jgi:hypothetical protein
MNLLQDILGLITRKQQVKPVDTDVLPIGRYKTSKEVFKPKPEMKTNLVTLRDLKNYISKDSSGDNQTLSLDGNDLSISNGNTVDLSTLDLDSSALPYTSSFARIFQSGTGDPSLSWLSNDAGLTLNNDTRIGVGQYVFGFTSAPAENKVMVVLPGGVRTGEHSVVSLFSTYRFQGGGGTLLIESYGITNADLLQPADIGFGGDNTVIVEIRVFN